MLNRQVTPLRPVEKHQGAAAAYTAARTHLPYATSVRASSGSEMRAAVAWCSRYAWCEGVWARGADRGKGGEWQGKLFPLQLGNAETCILATIACTHSTKLTEKLTRISGSTASRLAALLAGAWCPCCFGSFSSCCFCAAACKP